MKMELIGKILKKLGNKLINIANMLHSRELAPKTVKIKNGEERDLYRIMSGKLMWLKNTNFIDKQILTKGYFEYHLTNQVSKIIKPGDIVFDIGANIGYYSIIFSELVGKDGMVYCFEPTNYYSTILAENIKINEISNCVISKIGLSNRAVEAEIAIGDSTASIHNPGGLLNITKEKIKLSTLDLFVKENGIKKIDVIKIDIDGHEPLFFEGASDTLTKFEPIIILEISHLHYFEAGHTAWDFYEKLKALKYRIYHENDLLEIKTLNEFLIKCGNFSYSTNIIITKKALEY